MLESPLKKNKHSYPIDFSNKKNETAKGSKIKYDKCTDDQNPEASLCTKKSFVSDNKSTFSEMFIESNKKQSQRNQNDFIYSVENRKNEPIVFQGLNPQSKIQIYQGHGGSQQNEQPLRQVRKKNNRLIMDQKLLRNPRIQMNQQKNIKTSERTLETLSPHIIEKQSKIPEAGGIKRQDLSFYEKFQSERQNPLIPEKPFNLMSKNTKRNSLLDKLNLNKMKKTQLNNSELDSFVDSQIMQGNKFFRPQTYTYANKLIESQDQDNIRRASSSFDVQKKQKILYLNAENKNNFSFNLPDLAFGKHNINENVLKFRKINSQNDFTLKSKFSHRQNAGKFFTKPKNQPGLSHDFSEQNDSGVKFQLNQISKLKAQINLIAKNRFRNQFQTDQKRGQTERQFTFQQEQDKVQSQTKSNLRPSPKKKSKKLQITYHVPLSALKIICRRYISSPSEYSMAFKVPKIFMEKKLFSRSQTKDQLHENALLLFDSLKISSKDLVIKRYSNCIMFICGHIVVMWYYNGKRYLGGWQYQYLDQGSRHGLGLQWEPDTHVYYGEFRKNKKHGLGAMKEGPQKVTIGYWSNGKYVGKSFKEQNQAIWSQNQEENQHEDYAYEQSYLDRNARNFQNAEYQNQ